MTNFEWIKSLNKREMAKMLLTSIDIMGEDEDWDGGHAFAIPLNIYGNNTYENMIQYATMFFDHIQNIKHTKINHVYVDIQED